MSPIIKLSFFFPLRLISSSRSTKKKDSVRPSTFIGVRPVSMMPSSPPSTTPIGRLEATAAKAEEPVKRGTIKIHDNRQKKMTNFLIDNKQLHQSMVLPSKFVALPTSPSGKRSSIHRSSHLFSSHRHHHLIVVVIQANEGGSSMACQCTHRCVGEEVSLSSRRPRHFRSAKSECGSSSRFCSLSHLLPHNTSREQRNEGRAEFDEREKEEERA